MPSISDHVRPGFPYTSSRASVMISASRSSEGTMENSYDAILDWTTRREAVVDCSVSDIFRMRATRSPRGPNDGIFFLDQQPCRTVRVVGWVSAISFEPVHKDAVDSDVKVAVTIDDPDGEYNITVNQILNNRPSSIPLKATTTSTSSSYRLVPKNQSKQVVKPNFPARIEPKRPIYPNFRVGHVLKVKGRVNEWSRRDGRVIRELKVQESWGGVISIIDPVQELIHTNLVERLHRESYNRPFVIPTTVLPRSITTANKSNSMRGSRSAGEQGEDDVASPKKKRRVGMEPSSEVEMEGTMGMSSTVGGYGDRLRHPLKLNRKHLTLSTFTRYLSSYLERMTEDTWSTSNLASSSSSSRSSFANKTGDLESPESLEFAAKYMPELTWPTKEIQAVLVRKKAYAEKESGGPLDRGREVGGDDSTPRAHKVLRTGGTPRRYNPPGSSSSSTSIADENSQEYGSSTSTISGACSLDHLMHVDYLRDLADRVLRQEYRRRGERRRVQTPGLDRDQEKKKRSEEKEEYRQGRKRKLRRLFREGIRLKMMDEGSIVEVTLTSQDMEEQKIERQARRRKKATQGGDSLDAAWEASFGTSISDSVLGERSGWMNMDSLGGGSRSFLGSQSRSRGMVSSQKVLLANQMFPRPNGLGPARDESDDSEDESRLAGNSNPDNDKPDPIGYVSLSARVIGLAIMHVLNMDSWDRTKTWIPSHDPRRTNGMTIDEIRRRIAGLHERWERVGLDVVDAGIEDLLARGIVTKFGKGWKPTKGRLEGIF